MIKHSNIRLVGDLMMVEVQLGPITDLLETMVLLLGLGLSGVIHRRQIRSRLYEALLFYVERSLRVRYSCRVCLRCDSSVMRQTGHWYLLN